MCLGEIFWRIRRLLWQIYARLRHKRWELLYQQKFEDSSEILQTIDRINFYSLCDIQAENVGDDWFNGTIDTAEKLLQKRYCYLAVGEISLGEEINWNYEYKRGIETPLLFGPWMNYRDNRLYGDFKYFWELPRLQHLVTLSKAYYLTGKEDYAVEVVKQIKSFVNQSPYLLGVNWIMPMEASIRLISVSWITAFLKDYLRKDIEACNLIAQIVRSHVDYITKNYSAYSSANNHLVAEAVGVFIVGICFGHFDKFSSHRHKAWNILCKEIIHQHYADGVNKEQAVHYQVFALNFFLLAALLGKANNVEIPDKYWHMLENSSNFIAVTSDDNCSAPNIGDNDNGKALVLSETDSNHVRSILAVAAVLFNRGDLKAKAKVFDEMSFWLLGNKGKNKFDSIISESVPAVSKFDEGGYYILTSNSDVRTKIIFDLPPVGFWADSSPRARRCPQFHT